MILANTNTGDSQQVMGTVILTWFPPSQVLRAPAAGDRRWPENRPGPEPPCPYPGLKVTSRAVAGYLRRRQGSRAATHVTSHSAAIFTPTACESPNHVGKFSLEQCPARQSPGCWGLRVTDRGLPSLRAVPGGLPNSQLCSQAKHLFEFRCLPHRVHAV